MSYPPLSEVRDSLNPQWYRSKMPPARFKELSKRDDRKGWIQAGGHFALFCLTGSLVFVTWLNSLWALFFVSLFAHGTVPPHRSLLSAYKGGDCYWILRLLDHRFIMAVDDILL